jgi:transcriptional regulator with XRE-family HTH domain
MNDISVNNDGLFSDKMYLKRIGDFIRIQRQNQHKSQEQLAKDAGVSRSTLSLLERGENVRLDSLIQILRILNSLHIFDQFNVQEQISPIEYAKLKKKQTKLRVRNKKMNDNPKDDLGW